MFSIKDAKNLNRYVGASKAFVIDNRDPAHRRRIRVRHPLLGDTTWIEYLNDFGTFSMPAVGDIVYVQCDTGMYEYPFAWGKAPKGNFATPDTPTTFNRDVPTNRGLFSPGGNFIELDDGLATAGPDPKDTSLSTKNRGIRITTKSGHKIHIFDDPDNSTQSIVIFDKEGDGIVFDAQKKTVSTISKGKMDFTADDNITINANKDFEVKAPNGVESHDVKDFVVSASGQAQIQGNNAIFEGSSGTTVGSSSSTTNVNGQQVLLAGGGPGVARLGDRAFGIGNAGNPVSSTIIAGSSKVLSG